MHWHTIFAFFFEGELMTNGMMIRELGRAHNWTYQGNKGHERDRTQTVTKWQER